MNTVYKRYLLFRSWMGVIIRSFKSGIKVPFFSKVQLMLKGFLSDSYLLYNLKENSYKSYLSDYHRAKCRFINGSYSIILNDKLVFENVIAPYSRTPKTFAKVLQGEIYPIKRNNLITNIQDIFVYCLENDKLVFKPFKNSDGGRGVFVVSCKNNELYINEQVYTKESFNRLIKQLDNYMISEYINQGNFSKSLYYGSVNTVRILTMTNPSTLKPFIASAVYRIGTKASAPVDNWSTNGISCQIDLQLGKLSSGIIFKDRENIEVIENHPNTCIALKGKIVPNWDSIKKEVLRLAENLSSIPYIAWDIIVTEEEIVILEGNNCSDVNLIQVHEPLLTNKDVHDFYRYHKII